MRDLFHALWPPTVWLAALVVIYYLWTEVWTWFPS